MSCQHRYIVTSHNDKGQIQCMRCGDIRADGLTLEQTEDTQREIAERIKWERAKRRGLQLPDFTPSPIEAIDRA